MRLLSKPFEDGFIMPAEFEPPSGCLMLWPYRRDNWREQAIPAAKAFATVANLISTSEQVYMCIYKESVEIAKRLLSSRIQLIEMEYNDSRCIKTKRNSWDLNREMPRKEVTPIVLGLRTSTFMSPIMPLSYDFQ